LLTSLSWINGFQTLKQTKCNEWDDRELDVLDGIKFLAFLMLMILSTSLFFNGAPQNNVWKMLDFLKELFFTFIISCQQGTDFYLIIGGFLGTYKCIQIYDANGGKLYYKDVLKMYARKFLRLAPMLYLMFFLGWVITPRLKDAPAWPGTNQLFYECDKYWWAQLLFIGNIVPMFVEVTCGCFYWVWIVYCDM
jgi:peptidoglycan/LPS O-acetylase OafA/YrhL